MLNLVIGVITVLVLFIWYLKKRNDYWKDRNIPYEDGKLIVGNLGPSIIGARAALDIFDDIYKKYKGYKYCGVMYFGNPAIFVRDVEFLKDVLIKDFPKFHDNMIRIDENKDVILSKNPFFAIGDHWKQIRSQLAPQFTPMKVKCMFPLMDEVKDRLIHYLKTDPDATGNDGLNAKELATKYTVDMVASCAFGLNGNSFNDPKAEFRELGRQLFAFSPLDLVDQIFGLLFPELYRFRIPRLLSEKLTNRFKEIITSTIKERQERNIKRGDFLDAILELKEKTTAFDYNSDYMTAHALAFFLDGVETSAVALQYVLYELGANPDIQQKLREDFEDMLELNSEKLTYEGLHGVKYLDMIIDETLRKYPPFALLLKGCTETTTLPPAKEGAPELILEKGTMVLVPVLSIHNDEDYYDEPEKFIPERFADDAIESRPKLSYLPFGDGPRICLGRRFALAQIKVAVFAIVTNFDIEVNEKTPKKFVLDPMEFLHAIKGGIWLNYYERNKNN